MKTSPAAVLRTLLTWGMSATRAHGIDRGRRGDQGGATPIEDDNGPMTSIRRA